MLQIKPNNKEAFLLMHEGAQALAIAECNGIRIDRDYCEEQMNHIKTVKIPETEGKLFQFSEVQEWQRVYGDKFSLTSDSQLADILFNKLGHTPSSWTSPKDESKKKPKVDAEALEALDIPMVRELIKYRKFSKLLSTYLIGLLREEVDGFIHPFFNLHTVKTFRSSSDHPNFQNQPVRDPFAGKIVRGCFVPRPGHLLMSIDHGGIEVRAAEWYHRDPVMFEYIEDPSKDMHRDMAGEIYLLNNGNISKEARYSAKNGFVFPVFYGSYWRASSKSLWDNIEKLDLETKQEGTPLKKHLAEKGIYDFYDFEKHIQKVEDNFWNVRFKVYKQWKDKWFENYQKKGYFCSLSGFTYQGIMSRNEVINYPVQGCAFHTLLWSFTRLMDIFKKKKFNSKIVGQIHDEILIDVDPKELEDILEITQRVMCITIKKEWAPWINTSLSIETEISPVDGRWSELRFFKEFRG